MTERNIVGIVGMPGSGKSLFDEVAKEMGFIIVIMGDIVREEVVRRGLEPTPENIGKTMLKIRRENGPEVIAERCIPKIQEAKGVSVIVDGIRSQVEVEEFRRSFPKFTVIHIHSSPKTRFKRLFKRGRSDDPRSWNVFVERDYRELEVGVGSAIALADHVITNERNPQQFRANAKKLLKMILNGRSESIYRG